MKVASIGVSVATGAMATTRTPWGATSSARLLASVTTAPFDAAYVWLPGRGRIAAVEAVMRNTPRFCFFMTASAYFAPSHTPLTLTAKIRSKTASSCSSMCVGSWGTPALAKKTSSRPHLARAFSTIAWLSAAVETSARTASAWPPPFSRPAERAPVRERVRSRGLGLLLAPGQVQVLNRPGRRLIAVAARDVVVEVPAARPHATDVQREPRPDGLPARGDIVPDDDGDHGHDVEPRRRPAARAEPLVEPLAERLHIPWRKERGDPAVGDLRRECRVPGADRREIDRDVPSPVQDRLERLTEARRVRARVRDLVVLAAELQRLLTAEDPVHDLDVLARSPERLAEGLAVPALDHLPPRDAEPEPEATAREAVERQRGHRGRGRATAPAPQNPRADGDPGRPRGDPRRRCHRGRAIRLG